MKSFLNYLNNKKPLICENLSNKLPHIYFRGVKDNIHIPTPSPERPCWTGGYYEAQTYIMDNSDSGLAIFYIKDTSKIKALDILNKSQNKIFGNHFSYFMSNFHDLNLSHFIFGESIYAYIENILYSDMYFNEITPEINTNMFLQKIENVDKIKLDIISKNILTQLFETAKHFKSNNISINHKLIPIYTKIAAKHGYNIIIEHEDTEADIPSHMFIASNIFPMNEKCIYLIKNSEIPNSSNDMSLFDDVLENINVYQDINFYELIKKLNTIKQQNIK